LIGVYDYTVILTYLSLVSAGFGIIIALSDSGHPFFGVFFLMFCGLCDAFDGKVARMKQNRTQLEENYGIQIDSLSDLLAFGALPACIGAAMLRRSPAVDSIRELLPSWGDRLLTVVLFLVLVLYILAALIRLAYFNVTEEERKRTEGGVRKFYTGLPVTSAALMFPTVMLIQYLTDYDITPIYFIAVIITGFAFLSKFNIRKPGLRGILIMVVIGAAEFALMLILRALGI